MAHDPESTDTSLPAAFTFVPNTLAEEAVRGNLEEFRRTLFPTREESLAFE